MLPGLPAYVRCQLAALAAIGVVDLSSVQYSTAVIVLTGSSCQTSNERQLSIGPTCAAQDNWVVAWAPGASTDLAWEWANYKARVRVKGTAEWTRHRGA